MGFLIGGFGKLMAGKRLRSLQTAMMSIQSQLRKATRQSADMQKYFDNLEKSSKTNNSIWASGMMTMFQTQWQNDALQRCGFNSIEDFTASTDKAAKENYFQYMQAFATQNASQQQQLQAFIQMQNTMMEQRIEAMKEQMLQPLKDLEESLQLEKDSLESQIQLAQADYDACKEMEKAGAKNMVPNYTGQG